MQEMEHGRTQTRTHYRRPGPAYRTGSRMDQRPRQQRGVTGQNVLLSGTGEVGKLEDMDGNLKVVRHDGDPHIVLMKMLDARQILGTWCRTGGTAGAAGECPCSTLGAGETMIQRFLENTWVMERRYRPKSRMIGLTGYDIICLSTQVQVLELGGLGAAQVDRLSSQAHVEYLTQHVKRELAAPGRGDGKPATVDVLLDAGSGVTSISEELAACLQRTHLGEALVKPFQGNPRI